MAFSSSHWGLGANLKLQCDLVVLIMLYYQDRWSLWPLVEAILIVKQEVVQPSGLYMCVISQSDSDTQALFP